MSQTTITAEPGTTEVDITHVFDAPRERIFNALVDPAALPRWWGPSSLTTRVETLDARPGGRWRFVQHDSDGNEFAFRGEFREVEPPVRLSYTFEFEGMPGHVAIETVSLDERDGKTTLTDRTVFETVEERDGMIASGMESGARESMERLAEYVAPD